jgi:hypothetical protein
MIPSGPPLHAKYSGVLIRQGVILTGTGGRSIVREEALPDGYPGLPVADSPGFPGRPGSSYALTAYDTTIFDLSANFKKNILFFLKDACELLFQDIKSLLDAFQVLATRENDLS